MWNWFELLNTVVLWRTFYSRSLVRASSYRSVLISTNIYLWSCAANAYRSEFCLWSFSDSSPLRVNRAAARTVVGLLSRHDVADRSQTRFYRISLWHRSRGQSRTTVPRYHINIKPSIYGSNSPQSVFIMRSPKQPIYLYLPTPHIILLSWSACFFLF